MSDGQGVWRTAAVPQTGEGRDRGVAAQMGFDIRRAGDWKPDSPVS